MSITLDLTAMRQADRLVDEAAARMRTAPVLTRLSTVADQLDPSLREVVELIAYEIGRVGAAAETARQLAQSGRQSRSERIKLDPLRFIPASRQGTGPEPAGPLSLRPDAPEFIGAGWFEAEHHGDRAWRWSGAAGSPCATLLLPSLGSGRLRFTFRLSVPFQQPFEPERFGIVVNARPLALTATATGASSGVVTGETVVEDDHALGSLAVVLVLPRYGARDGGVNDTRQLGVGIEHLQVEKVEG
jgi:hypothetical protein